MATSFHLLIKSLLFSLLASHARPTNPVPKRVVTKLIHRDSILSPYYNPDDTLSDRAQRFLEGSTARLAYLRAKALDAKKVQFDLVPSFPVLFVNFSLGYPPVPQFAIVDTGSNLLWVQCLPCKNCSQKGHILDPTKSLTYSRIPCFSSYCSNVPNGQCGSMNQCTYYQTYYDGPASSGELARELLTFETSEEGPVSVPDVVFGCGHQNGRYRHEKFSGVFGLGGQIISVVAKLRSKFSYCLGDLLDPNYGYNRMILGEGAILEGSSTPMRVIDGLYHITLEGISIGATMLKLDSGRSNGNRRRGDTIIDSGTPLTWLANDAYWTLFHQVRSLLDGVLEQVHNMPLQLCYHGSVYRDLIGFPAVTLHLADDAEIVLETRSLFYQANSDVFCMAMVQSSIRGLSIIGLIAQQNYNIGFDVTGVGCSCNGSIASFLMTDSEYREFSMIPKLFISSIKHESFICLANY